MWLCISTLLLWNKLPDRISLTGAFDVRVEQFLETSYYSKETAI